MKMMQIKERHMKMMQIKDRHENDANQGAAHENDGSFVNQGVSHHKNYHNRSLTKKQCTISWYVDDMKISHVNPDLVTQFIQDIETKFGKMSVSRGHKHNS